LVSVLLGTALLAVLGFGLGVAAGLVLEEPALLLDYLTGRTRPAPLEVAREERDLAPPPPAPADSLPQAAAVREPEPPAPAARPPEPAMPPVATAPPVAAPAPAPAEPAEEVEEAAPAEEPDTTPPVAFVPRAQGGYSVQVGALADAASAEELAGKLRKSGYAVYVAPSAEPGSRRWRVRVGPVASRSEAQQLAERLAREKLPTWVLAEGPR
jgi:DedD protein